MQGLVSIIIPLYNAENFIAETLQSALNQSYKNIEIIIVDDGSSDSSLKIVQQFQQHNILVVQQQNSGASAARNHGLRLAKGDYIQYLDADDILHPDKIKSQFDISVQFGSHYAVGCQWKYFKTSTAKPYRLMPFAVTTTTQFDKIDWLKDRPYMIPHTWLLPRKLIDAAGPWDEKLSLNDDGEYFYRLIAASSGVVLQDQVLAYYRAGNPNSLSTRRTKTAMNSWFESIISYKKVMLALAEKDAHEAIDRSFFEVAYYCLNIYPDLYQKSKAEMFNPSVNYFEHDKVVYNLSKIVGLSKAKKVRQTLDYLRNTPFIDTLFSFAKRLAGKEVY